jgi:Carboxypeptidase regulatory-like domain
VTSPIFAYFSGHNYKIDIFGIPRTVGARRLLLTLVIALVALPLFLQPYAFGQSMFATLSGTVTDSSGGVISGAKVTVKPMNSTDTRKTVTNQEGFFSVPTLPAGVYEVQVEMKGFQSWQGRDITLNGADSRLMKIEMKVGSASETVVIEGTVTQLAQTDSGEKSALISSEDLQNLSLVGRNATEYLKILPGASLATAGGINKAAYSGQVVGINGFCAGNGCNAGGLSGVNINGQSANITQDGQNTFDPGAFGAATPVNPNPDMISEVKVMTSNFSSENAKGPVVVNTETKSGGSTFHGEGYMYARNHVMNATDHFNKDTRINQPKPNDSYYFPGGNIGGPLYIPGTGFNKSHQKLFFFEAFEYYDQHLDGGVDRAYVPTAANLAGDFSAYNGNSNSGGHSVLQTPVSAPKAGAWTGFDTRAAGGCTITGGVLSAACIDPNALAYLKAVLPAPNVDPSTHSGFNYVQQFAAPQTSWQNVVRGDWNVSDNTKFYVTWSRQRETANMPTGLWVGAGDWAVPTPSATIGANGSDSTTVTFVHVFSPTMTVESRFGYTKIDFPSSPADLSKYLRSNVGYNLTGIFGSTNIPANVTWGDSAPNMGDVGHDYHPTMIANKGIPSASADLTKVLGTHTAKFGFFFEHVYNKQDNWGQFMGVYQYASWAGSPTGNEYADMLMGIGQAGYFEQALPPPTDISQNVASWYAQDSWKLNRRITVNYGLRFEHYAKPYAPGFGMAAFNPLQYDPNAPANTNTGVSWNANNPLTPLSGTSSRFLFFSPRFGAAIDVFGTGRTVVRGGWGKYRAYDSVQSNAYTGPAQTALGSVTWTCGSNDPLCPTWEAIDSHAFTPVFGHPSLTGTSFSAADPTNDEQPLTTSYSLTLFHSAP